MIQLRMQYIISNVKIVIAILAAILKFQHPNGLKV